MAFTTFIPTIWEARLLANFHNRSLASVISTKPTKIEGNKITFGNVGSITVKDYTGTVEYDDLEIPEVELNIDQKKYFAFKVDDVDRVQAAGPLIDEHTREAAYTMAEVGDKYAFSLLSGKAGTKIGDKNAHEKNAYDLIVDMGTKLNKKKVPKANRYCVIDSEYLGLLSKDPRFTNNPKILENGIVEGQLINTMQICVSEELPVASSKTTIIALHSLGLGFAMQLDEVEALRLQGAFADAVRGLEVYGAASLKPEAVVTMNVTVVEAPTTQVNVVNTTDAPVNTKEVAGA
jgi:hypothetical protein